MQKPVFINDIVSLSALGDSAEKVWSNLKEAKPKFQEQDFHGNKVMVSALPKQANKALEAIRNERKLYNNLDKSALMAIIVGRKLFDNANEKPTNFGVNIGSSRGATDTFEKAHQTYLHTRDVPIHDLTDDDLGKYCDKRSARFRSSRASD